MSDKMSKMNAIILHGKLDKKEYLSEDYPSPSNFHWLPWLQKQLIMRGILTQTPEMPRPYDPVYLDWKKEFERFDVNEETILIGHSCGAGFLVRWLSENKVSPCKLVLVAPWLDPDREIRDFFEFEISKDIGERTEVYLLFSKDDMRAVLSSSEILISRVSKMKVHKFQEKGHFCLSEIGPDFPELLEIILEGIDMIE